MKAEHRKELHTNALASQLNRLVEGVKSRPDTRSLAILAGIALIVVLFFGWRFLSNRSANQRSALWVKLESASSTKELDRLAQDNRGTLPARVARFQVARVQLQEGLEHLAANEFRAPGEKSPQEKIKEAMQEYDRLADDCRDVPVLAQEALMGAAKARESLGDLDSALSGYEKLAKAYPKSAPGIQAAERAERLKQQRVQLQGFYKKLETDLAKKE